MVSPPFPVVASIIPHSRRICKGLVARGAGTAHHATSCPGRRGALRGAFRWAGCVTRCLLATEIPPAGAPPGGRGSLCGVVWLSRSPFHPVCRYDEVICSEMTRRVAGAWDEKQNAVSVSLTELYFQPSKLRTMFRFTHRVILSEAAPPAKNQARPPVIAAQSNPAPQAGRQQAGSPLFQRDHVTHTAPRLPMGKGNCTQ